MAAARPALHDPKEVSEAARDAEANWRGVVDAQRDDLESLRRRWPDRTSPEASAALSRLLRRAAPDGEVDEAMRTVHAAYGGYDRVPNAVRRRLERYVDERMAVAPWPERDLSESTDEPALLRKQRRQRRGQA